MARKKTDAVTTIPALPCTSLADIQSYYEALGFRLTYQQKAPHVYAVLRRDDWELHFFGLRGLKPEESYSTCLVLVPEVEHLHEVYSGALRQLYGRLPVRGFPRISRMRPGQTRFTAVDPSGNSVIYIKREEPQAEDSLPKKNVPLSRMDKALALAATLRDSKGDDVAAAKVLDQALARGESTPEERVRALAARAELAVALGELALARSLCTEFESIPLPKDIRRRLKPEMDAVKNLERSVEYGDTD